MGSRWVLLAVLGLGASAGATTFTCEADGTATRCPNATECFSLGPCPLGCSETDQRCYVPSNVAPQAFLTEAGPVTLLPMQSPYRLDTDTGLLADRSGIAVRPPGEGPDLTSGIAYQRREQLGGPDVGVFVVDDLVIPAGVTLNVTGTRPLVLLSKNSVFVDGTIDVGARGTVGGPGGFDGGTPGESGTGPCAGPAAPLGTDMCPDLCAAGAGGAGHGGPGGAGGDVNLPAYSTTYPLTAGAGVCGVVSLTPLVGGSGGAGGALPGTYTSGTPGLTPVPPSGGGGGGAIQISAAIAVVFGPTGVITAPGEGATASVSAGGGSGGAGGAILLEAPDIILDPQSVLAANGGGGGGGDCT